MGRAAGRPEADTNRVGNIANHLGELLGNSGQLRSRSTTVENEDGSVNRIINIGVPSGHPMAAPEPNGPAGLHNMRLGPFPMPAAPTFIIRMRRPRNSRGNLANLGNPDPENRRGPAVNIAPHREPTEDELRQIDSHVDHITQALNVMIGRFQELFIGRTLARVSRAFEGVSAEEFRNNFDQAFSPDEQILEMVRRISLREYEEQQRKNRASEESVKKLPIIIIEAKHCRQKPLEQGNVAKAMLKKKRANKDDES